MQQPETCLKEEETGIHRKLLAPSHAGSFPSIDLSRGLFSFHSPLQIHSGEFSVWAFLCVNNLLGYSKSSLTLQAKVKASLGWCSRSSEASAARFIQREETLIAFKPTSVITTDHRWEMNTYFFIVLT